MCIKNIGQSNHYKLLDTKITVSFRTFGNKMSPLSNKKTSNKLPRLKIKTYLQLNKKWLNISIVYFYTEAWLKIV